MTRIKDISDNELNDSFSPLLLKWIYRSNKWELKFWYWGLGPFSATASLNTKCIVIPSFLCRFILYSCILIIILLCRIEQYHNFICLFCVDRKRAVQVDDESYEWRSGRTCSQGCKCNVVHNFCELILLIICFGTILFNMTKEVKVKMPVFVFVFIYFYSFNLQSIYEPGKRHWLKVTS